MAGLERHYAGEPDGTLRRKLARQAARSVLPNATETRIFVTANARALRHFIEMRGSEAADVEIRKVALQVLDLMRRESPALFSDYERVPLPDGGRGGADRPPQGLAGRRPRAGPAPPRDAGAGQE